MKIIEKEYEIEFIEKKSRFIAYLSPVNSIEEANKYIESIRKKHITATHNVPLYRVIENGQEYFKYNDDGEPSGTAAKPMADIVERKELYNIAMVVTRYFGGIKLGAGGLIRNYARAAKEVLEICDMIDYVEKVNIIIIFDYTKKSQVDKIIDKNNMEILEQSYLDKINIKLKLRKEDVELFNNLNVNIITL